MNGAIFLSDYAKAVNIDKQPGTPQGSPVEDKTISLIWVCTGVPNLSKASLSSYYVCTYALILHIQVYITVHECICECLHNTCYTYVAMYIYPDVVNDRQLILLIHTYILYI